MQGEAGDEGMRALEAGAGFLVVEGDGEVVLRQVRASFVPCPFCAEPLAETLQFLCRPVVAAQHLVEREGVHEQRGVDLLREGCCPEALTLR